MVRSKKEAGESSRGRRPVQQHDEADLRWMAINQMRRWHERQFSCFGSIMSGLREYADQTGVELTANLIAPNPICKFPQEVEERIARLEDEGIIPAGQHHARRVWSAYEPLPESLHVSGAAPEVAPADGHAIVPEAAPVAEPVQEIVEVKAEPPSPTPSPPRPVFVRSHKRGRPRKDSPRYRPPHLR